MRKVQSILPVAFIDKIVEFTKNRSFKLIVPIELYHLTILVCQLWYCTWNMVEKLQYAVENSVSVDLGFNFASRWGLFPTWDKLFNHSKPQFHHLYSERVELSFSTIKTTTNSKLGFYFFSWTFDSGEKLLAIF